MEVSLLLCRWPPESIAAWFLLRFLWGSSLGLFSQGSFEKLFLLFWSTFWDFQVTWVVYVDENIHVLWFFLDLIITSNLGLLLYGNLRPSKAISFEKVLVGIQRALLFLFFLCLTWLGAKGQTKVTFFLLIFFPRPSMRHLRTRGPEKFILMSLWSKNIKFVVFDIPFSSFKNRGGRSNFFNEKIMSSSKNAKSWRQMLR